MWPSSRPASTRASPGSAGRSCRDGERIPRGHGIYGRSPTGGTRRTSSSLIGPSGGPSHAPAPHAPTNRVRPAHVTRWPAGTDDALVAVVAWERGGGLSLGLDGARERTEAIPSMLHTQRPRRGAPPWNPRRRGRRRSTMPKGPEGSFRRCSPTDGENDVSFRRSDVISTGPLSKWELSAFVIARMSPVSTRPTNVMRSCPRGRRNHRPREDASASPPSCCFAKSPTMWTNSCQSKGFARNTWKPRHERGAHVLGRRDRDGRGLSAVGGEIAATHAAR